MIFQWYFAKWKLGVCVTFICIRKCAAPLQIIYKQTDEFGDKHSKCKGLSRKASFSFSVWTKITPYCFTVPMLRDFFAAQMQSKQNKFAPYNVTVYFLYEICSLGNNAQSWLSDICMIVNHPTHGTNDKHCGNGFWLPNETVSNTWKF